MLTKTEAIEKIRKCLALGKSSNAHEAATALRQARKLMEKFSLELADIKLTEYGMTSCLGLKTPSKGITTLLNSVARAFGCSSFYRNRSFVFVGPGISHEIAAYSFIVVRRHLKQSWDLRLSHPDIRFMNRTQKANLKNAFEIGFASGVYLTVSAFAAAVSPEDHALHCAKIESETGAAVHEVKGRKVTLCPNTYQSYQEGIAAGKKVLLHQPLNGGQETLKIAAGK